MLICPKCFNKLTKENKSYKCTNNHTYDISKEGYTNLLLSRTSCGDSIQSCQCRKLFLDSHYYENLVLHIKDILISQNVKTVLDIGCGVGYYSKYLSNYFDMTGIDISKEAVKLASKHDKKSSYFVASSFALPFESSSFDSAISIFAPISVDEIKRVLKNNKCFILVLPNTNHLIELKTAIYDKPYLNKTDNNLLPLSLLDKSYVTYKVNINNDDLNRLVQMTPYFYKTKKEDLDKLNKYNMLEVTIDFICYTYVKKDD